MFGNSAILTRWRSCPSITDPVTHRAQQRALVDDRVEDGRLVGGEPLLAVEPELDPLLHLVVAEGVRPAAHHARM